MKNELEFTNSATGSAWTEVQSKLYVLTDILDYLKSCEDEEEFIRFAINEDGALKIITSGGGDGTETVCRDFEEADTP